MMKKVIQSFVVTCFAIVCIFVCNNNETIFGNTLNVQETVIVNYDYDDIYGFTNDLTYKSYGNAFVMESGSTLTLNDLKIDVADDSDVWICMLNKMNGEETLIAEYTGQTCIEYTVTKDGAYKIYARAVKGDEERILDLNNLVDVSFMHTSGGCITEGEKDADGHILQLN